MRWQNQENTAPIPMKQVGPIWLHTPHGSSEIEIPLATFETPLWPSVHRGAKLTHRAGGIRAVVVRENMTRSVLLETTDVFTLLRIQEKILSDLPKWQMLAKETSRFLELKTIHAQPIGNQLFLRLSFQTGDAAGHNMVTLAADHLLNHWLKQFPELAYVSISGNLCTDKKTSSVNSLLGRGKYVIAETLISETLCKRYLKITPEQLTRLHVRKNLLGSIAAGSLHSANAHAANMLLALYLATGQDAANIVEGSQAIVHAETRENQLYFSVTLPNLIVGSVGNGKQIEFARNNLMQLGCLEPNAPAGKNAAQLAMIAAAAVLCGELSLLAALALPNALMHSHLMLEREFHSNNKKEHV